MIIDCVLGAVGKTPLIKLPAVDPFIKANIYAKLEFLNPSGSVKDRIAKYIVEKAEKEGRLNNDSIIVEVTSGNTGIAFAMVAACKKYALKIFLREDASEERVKLMESFGAEVIMRPKTDSYLDMIEQSKEMARKNPRIFLPQQFENEDNTEAHYLTTGKEILDELNHIDAVVAGVGTGGTLMGIAKAVKEVNPEVKIVAVEPAESAVMSGKEAGFHKIEGIGDGLIPDIVDMNLIDEIIEIKSNDAVQWTDKLIKTLGTMVGISSGANVLASLETAKKIGPDKIIVTLLPDRGERYFSTDLFCK